MKIAHRDISPAPPPAGRGRNRHQPRRQPRRGQRHGARCAPRRLRDGQAPDAFRRRRNDRRGQTDLPAQRRQIHLGRDGRVRAVQRRRDFAQDLRRVARHDLHLHAVLARRRRLPQRHRRVRVQDRLGRVQPRAADPPHRQLRQAHHHEHRHADHRRHAPVGESAGRFGCGLRAAGVHQPLPFAARDREPARHHRIAQRLPARRHRLLRPQHRPRDGAVRRGAGRLHPGAPLHRHALPQGPGHFVLHGPGRAQVPDRPLARDPHRAAQPQGAHRARGRRVPLRARLHGGRPRPARRPRGHAQRHLGTPPGLG